MKNTKYIKSSIKKWIWQSNRILLIQKFDIKLTINKFIQLYFCLLLYIGLKIIIYGEYILHKYIRLNKVFILLYIYTSRVVTKYMELAVYILGLQPQLNNPFLTRYNLIYKKKKVKYKYF